MTFTPRIHRFKWWLLLVVGFLIGIAAFGEVNFGRDPMGGIFLAFVAAAPITVALQKLADSFDES